MKPRATIVAAALAASLAVAGLTVLANQADAQPAIDAGVKPAAADAGLAKVPSKDATPAKTPDEKKTPWTPFMIAAVAAMTALVWEHFVASTKWASNSTVQLVKAGVNSLLSWLTKKYRRE